MVIFVTNCCLNLREDGVIALLLCNKYLLLKCIFSYNYTKVELKILSCLCMYVTMDVGAREHMPPPFFTTLYIKYSFLCYMIVLFCM